MASVRTPQPDPGLMTALGFSYEDLEANRQGVMTLRQLGVLGERSHEYPIRLAIGTVAIAILVLPILAPALWAFMTNSQVRSTDNAILLIIVLGILAIPAIFLWLTLQEHYEKYNTDKESARVKYVTGIIKRSTRYIETGKGGYIRYEINCKAEQFFVTQSVYEAFHDMAEYVIYFSPNTRLILSVELIPINNKPTEISF